MADPQQGQTAQPAPVDTSQFDPVPGTATPAQSSGSSDFDAVPGTATPPQHHGPNAAEQLAGKIIGAATPSLPFLTGTDIIEGTLHPIDAIEHGWQRLKNAVAAPDTVLGSINQPNGSTQDLQSAVENAKQGNYGQAALKATRALVFPIRPDDPVLKNKLIKPEELLSEDYQREHPIHSEVVRYSGGLTSPENLALMELSGGLNLIKGPAGPVVRSLIAKGFSGLQIVAAFREIPGLRDQLNNGDQEGAERTLTRMALDVTAGALGGQDNGQRPNGDVPDGPYTSAVKYFQDLVANKAERNGIPVAGKQGSLASLTPQAQGGQEAGIDIQNAAENRRQAIGQEVGQTQAKIQASAPHARMTIGPDSNLVDAAQDVVKEAGGTSRFNNAGGADVEPKSVRFARDILGVNKEGELAGNPQELSWSYQDLRAERSALNDAIDTEKNPDGTLTAEGGRLVKLKQSLAKDEYSFYEQNAGAEQIADLARLRKAYFSANERGASSTLLNSNSPEAIISKIIKGGEGAQSFTEDLLDRTHDPVVHKMLQDSVLRGLYDQYTLSDGSGVDAVKLYEHFKGMGETAKSLFGDRYESVNDILKASADLQESRIEQLEAKAKKAQRATSIGSSLGGTLLGALGGHALDGGVGAGVLATAGGHLGYFLGDRFFNLGKSGAIEIGVNPNETITISPSEQSVPGISDAISDFARATKSEFKTGQQRAVDRINALLRANEARQTDTPLPENQFVYHASDVSRANGIRENGLKPNTWYAATPEQAVQAAVAARKMSQGSTPPTSESAIPINKADMRIYAVPKGEISPVESEPGDVGHGDANFTMSGKGHDVIEVDPTGRPLRSTEVNSNRVPVKPPKTRPSKIIPNEFIPSVGPEKKKDDDKKEEPSSSSEDWEPVEGTATAEEKPESGEEKVADAITKAEGAKPELNNPGDLKLPGTETVPAEPGEPGISKLSSPEEGRAALINQIRKIVEGESKYYSPEETIEEVGDTWANHDPNWAKNVAREFNLPVTAKFRDLAAKMELDEAPKAKWADYAKPGPYVTPLEPAEEAKFEKWVKDNKIPWKDSPNSDYDMRGYWKAMVAGDKYAHTEINKQDHKPHYPDTWKTPYHKTFSNESQYALPNAGHWEGDTFIPPKEG